MKYFSPKFFQFFDGLTEHNTKEWFDANRDMYENEVKQPFRTFVEVLTEKLAKDLPDLNRNVAKAIFRINRDIRFSNDKSPYKNHLGAVFSRTGTKDDDYPGFYLHMGAKEVLVGGGLYMLNKETLQKMRQEILYNPAGFKKVVEEKKFKELFGTLKGEQNKVLPIEYKEMAATQPLIANKQFYFMAPLERKGMLSDKADELVLKYFKAAMKVQNFLWETVKE